jgi:hypothetical protein
MGGSARIPASSPVSPLCISGCRRPDAAVTASVDGRPQRVLDLPETGFYFDAALHRSRAVTVQVGEVVADVTWTPTVLSGDHDIVLRTGDSLLLTSPVPVRYSIVKDSGIVQQARTLPAGIEHPVTFRQTGTHQIVAKDRDGFLISTLHVTVIGIDFDGPVAGMVGYRRDKGVEIHGGLSDDVEFTSSDESLLTVAFKEETDYGARVFLTPLRRGGPTLVARVVESGAIIGTQGIDEFTVSSDSMIAAVRNIDDGSAGVDLVIRPWIPHLEAQLTLFAHRTTFEGGGKQLAISTDRFDTTVDPVTNELIGQTRIQINIPEDESLYCFKLTMDQHSRHGTPVGGSTFNGAACDFEVARLEIEQGDVAQHPLVITEGASNPDNQHHGKHKRDHPIALVAPAGNHLVLAPDPANGATFDCVKENNWRPLVNAKPTAKTGLYSVTIHGTLFKDKIDVYSNCTFELTAVEERMGKDKLYRCFPGTSATITAKLLKKGSRDPGTHRLVVSGPTAVPPFDIACPATVGQSVSVKVDAFALKLAAGSYDARILSTTKTAIFTVVDRQTLNNIIDSYGGQELGFVVTGGSSISETNRAVQTANNGGVLTVTVTGTFPVTYENNNQITNFLSPGGAKEWSPGERAKAPADEVANWGQCVQFVQTHEAGHLTVWRGQQAPRTETVIGTGSGATQQAANTAALADYTAKATALVQAVPAAIRLADDTAQQNYHQTPAGSSDLSPFKIPGRD